MGREARSETDPIPVGGPIAPENIATSSESSEPAAEPEGDEEEGEITDV